MIRECTADDIQRLITLYRKFFEKHSVFTRSDEEIRGYLERQTDTCLVEVDEEGVHAATFLVRKGEEQGHALWKLRHFAYETGSAAEQLLAEAERRITEASETAKIECTLAEDEASVGFFRSHGYAQEGAFKHHYRWDEDCLVFGKAFQ